MNPNIHPLTDPLAIVIRAWNDGHIPTDEFLDFMVNRNDVRVTRFGDLYMMNEIKAPLTEIDLENGNFSKVLSKPVDINSIISDIEKTLEENNG